MNRNINNVEDTNQLNGELMDIGDNIIKMNHSLDALEETLDDIDVLTRTYGIKSARVKKKARQILPRL